MRQRILAGIVLGLTAVTANAALLGRLPRTPGGTDYQAYYDTDLNITWLADANLANTETFGVSGISIDPPPFDLPSGYMDWNVAQNWLAAMNAANYLGVNDWRLPTVTDTGTSGCNFAFTGTDCGYNVDLSTSEMAHMFYNTLGNTGLYNTSGTLTGCSAPAYCLTNDGPFSNLQSYFYWSGTTYAPQTIGAWHFFFTSGLQDYDGKEQLFYAWAVRTGDIGQANIAVSDSAPPYNDLNIPFGAASPGQRITKTVTITNNGNAALILDYNSLGSMLRPPFSHLWSGDDNDCRFGTVSPSMSCTVQVLFAPTSVGTFSGVLDIPSNDPDTPSVSVSLSGSSQSAYGAPRYTITDLGTAGYSSGASGINDAGEIVGDQCLENIPWPNNNCHAVLWSPGGGVQDLGTLGGNLSYAFKVNNAGVVIGTSTNANGDYRTFIWTPTVGMLDLASVTGGSFQYQNMNDVGQLVGWESVGDSIHAHVWSLATGDVDLGLPPGRYSSNGIAINNLGVVLGNSDSNAWIRTSNGGYTNVRDQLFPSYVYPKNINDQGVVVGNASYSTESDVPDHAFQWSAATGMKDLAPGIFVSSAGVVNRRGDMLGSGSDGQQFANDDNDVALFWTAEGEMFTFDGLAADMTGWQHLNGGADINNRGQIVGSGTTANGETHAVLLTPILPDTDGDEFPDRYDNCVNVSNPDQYDADNDGFGNLCDADLNNSGLTTATDYNLLRSCLNRPATTSAVCAAADMNGSGLVTATDFNLLRARINTAPGPSGLHP